jgi:hypothetical protein
MLALVEVKIVALSENGNDCIVGHVFVASRIVVEISSQLCSMSAKPASDIVGY